ANITPYPIDYAPFASAISLFLTIPSTTMFYTLSLHDALPICLHLHVVGSGVRRERSKSNALVGPRSTSPAGGETRSSTLCGTKRDRKSTRLNSSHSQISYAVFCLKTKISRYAAPTRKQQHAST